MKLIVQIFQVFSVLKSVSLIINPKLNCQTFSISDCNLVTHLVEAETNIIYNQRLLRNMGNQTMILCVFS